MKPYSSYKDSGIAWIGPIPSHWEIKGLRSYLTMISEKGHGDKQLLSVTREQGVIVRNTDSKEENHNFIPDDLNGYKLVKKGQFAINKMKSWQGSYGVSEYEGIVSPAYFVCDLTFPYKPFFSMAIRSKAYIPFFTQYSKGIRVDQWDLFPLALKSIPFIEPPVDEQEAIVRFITEKSEKIDRYIAEQECLLAALDELRQAEIARAVTRGLNPDAALRDSGIEWIGSIPAHWELLRLKNCGSIYSGLSGKSGKDFEIDEDDNDFALFVPFTNIFNNSRIRKDKMAKVKVQPNEQQNEVLNGDLLFLMSSEDFNGIGKCSLYALEMNTPVYLNSFCKGFRVTNPKVTPAYLCYLMNTPACKTYIDNNSHGFIRINLRQDILTACPIILPPLDEQRAIVEYLDAKTAKIDRMKADIEKQIGLLKEYKQRMISDAVTGKIDVRE